MRNVRNFLRYLVPILALPMIYSIFSVPTTVLFARFGSTVLASRSALSTVNAPFTSIIYIISLAALAFSALLAESGKVKTARLLHLIALLVYVGVLTLMCALYLFGGSSILTFYGTGSDVIELGIRWMRISALVLLLVTPISALPAQLSGKYSFVLTMAVCGGITLTCGLLSLIIPLCGLGINTATAIDYVGFFASGIAPFLMIPIKRYSESFAPSADLRKE